MRSRYYDVVFIGAQLAPLVAGALLAKRGFRVLIIEQDELPPTYPALEQELPRAPFRFLPARSPAVTKVLAELALTQTLRRRSTHPDPAFQVALPDLRLDLPGDPALLEREIERELPEVKRPVEDFLAKSVERSTALDHLVEQEIAWPPEGFFERRAHTRARAGLPFSEVDFDPLDELPERHPFRAAVELPVRFAEGMDPDYGSALRTIRHFDAWRRGSASFAGGYASLRELLVESLTTHGGALREREKADRVLVRRGAAEGVRMAASGEEIGAGAVVFGGTIDRALRLLADRSPFEELFEKVGEPVVRYYRYTLNLVLAAEGVPEAMGRDLFCVGERKRALAGANALWVQAGEADEAGRRLLCAQALLPRRLVEEVPDYLETARERIVATLGGLLPFMGKHLLLMDSPHDGRPILDLANKRIVDPDEPWSRGPGHMRALHGYPVTDPLGLSALPARTPIRDLFLCSEQVIPGLGDEGAFLAARSLAHILTRRDRGQAALRRGRWGKIDLG